MRISEQTIEKIMQSNDIVDVISDYVSLKRTGRNFVGVCPFHNDKGPSLSVSPDKQLYHCFGCGAAGNVVGFVMKIRNLEYVDAIKYLADRANIQIDDSGVRDSTYEKILEMNIKAARYYYENLKLNKEKMNYLLKRNLDIKTIRKFGLGYSQDSFNALLNYLKKQGYDEELILKGGLASRGDKGIYDRFRNRVMFPVFDYKGRVIGFGGRVLDDSKPKYLNSPETVVFKKGTNLYGLNFVLRNGTPKNLIIVEGYMDCIALHQFGIENVVASLGTALTKEQAKLIKRYCKDVYLSYDSDEAGKTATLKGIDVLLSEDLNVKIINIPKGKDPDEYIKNNGVEAFRDLIDKALPAIEHLINSAKEGKNFSDPISKSKFVKEVVTILNLLKTEVEIQTYASKIYDMTGINVAVILDEVKRLKSRNKENWNKNDDNRNNIIGGNIFIEPGFRKAERILLSICIENNDWLNYIKERLSQEDFITESYRKVAKMILDDLVLDSNVILKSFVQPNEVSDVAKIFVINENLDINSEIIDGYINTIKKSKIEFQIDNLTRQIKESESKNDFTTSIELTKKLVELQKQLSLL